MVRVNIFVASACCVLVEALVVPVPTERPDVGTVLLGNAQAFNPGPVIPGADFADIPIIDQADANALLHEAHSGSPGPVLPNSGFNLRSLMKPEHAWAAKKPTGWSLTTATHNLKKFVDCRERFVTRVGRAGVKSSTLDDAWQDQLVVPDVADKPSLAQLEANRDMHKQLAKDFSASEAEDKGQVILEKEHEEVLA